MKNSDFNSFCERNASMAIGSAGVPEKEESGEDSEVLEDVIRQEELWQENFVTADVEGEEELFWYMLDHTKMPFSMRMKD